MISPLLPFYPFTLFPFLERLCKPEVKLRSLKAIYRWRAEEIGSLLRNQKLWRVEQETIVDRQRSSQWGLDPET
jgi:hypothetical protein